MRRIVSIRKFLFPDKEPTFRGNPDDLSPEQRAELGLTRVSALIDRAAQLQPVADIQEMFMREEFNIREVSSASSERPTGPSALDETSTAFSGSGTVHAVLPKVAPAAIHVDVSGQEPEKSRFDLIDLGSLDKQDE